MKRLAPLLLAITLLACSQGTPVEVATMSNTSKPQPPYQPEVQKEVVSNPTTTTTTTLPPTPKIRSSGQASAAAVVVPDSAPPPDGDAAAAAIAQWFPNNYQSAYNVASCESTGGHGLDPSAVSPGGGNWGLFQINTVHKERVANMGYSWDQILDPYINAEVAASIYGEQGWGPWSCRWAA